MPTSNRFIQPTEGGISGRAIALGVMGFLILAVGFFFLGARVIGPLALSYMRPHQTAEQAYQSPTVPPSDQERPASPNNPAGKQSPLDIQITEEGKDQSSGPSDSTPSDNGVKQDENGLTVTLEPDKPKEKASSPLSETDSKPADVTKANSGVTTEPSAQPALAAHSGSRTRYRILAGSFANKVNADNLAADLRKHGYAPEIKTVQREAGTLYRVDLGEYRTREDAQSAVDDLASKGYSPALSTSRP